jgi:hypothetical protein
MFSALSVRHWFEVLSFGHCDLGRSPEKKIPDITNLRYWIPTSAGMTGQALTEKFPKH